MIQQYQNYFFNFILAVIAFILVMLVTQSAEVNDTNGSLPETEQQP